MIKWSQLYSSFSPSDNTTAHGNLISNFTFLLYQIFTKREPLHLILSSDSLFYNQLQSILCFYRILFDNRHTKHIETHNSKQ